jgi:FkbM family methyltransferase
MKRSFKKVIYSLLSDSSSATIVACYRFFRYGIIRYLQSQYLFFTFRKPTIVSLGYGGLQLYVDPQNGATDQAVFLHHSRDDDVIELMKSCLKAGETYIDIGANIGYETVFGSIFVGQKGSVIAFEPVPRLADQLHKNCVINGLSNVQIIKKAVGKELGFKNIYLQAHDAGSSSITNESGSTSKETIEVTTLDSLHLTQAHFVKIDVEGYEPEVFLGGATFFSKLKPKIIFEFQPHLYGITQTLEGSALLSFIHETLGYSLFQMLPEGLVPFPSESFKRVTEVLKAEQTLVNIFAC